jgi:hypothetical protein
LDSRALLHWRLTSAARVRSWASPGRFYRGKIGTGKKIFSKYLDWFMSVSFLPASFLSSSNSISIRRTSGRSCAVFEQKFSPLGNRGTSRKKIPSFVNGRDSEVDPGRSGVVQSV